VPKIDEALSARSIFKRAGKARIGRIMNVGFLILRILFTLWNAKPIPLGRLFAAISTLK
jgi:hypothetical protein